MSSIGRHGVKCAPRGTRRAKLVNQMVATIPWAGDSRFHLPQTRNSPATITIHEAFSFVLFVVSLQS